LSPHRDDAPSRRPQASIAQAKDLAQQRRALLESICLALRADRKTDAAALIALAVQVLRRDAALLNLEGVLYELRRQWKQARRSYGKAIRADRHYAPAQQNMRRLYELYTFGWSDLAAALGDDAGRSFASSFAVDPIRACKEIRS
jgi:Flp pilus assembly protein TadD